MAVKMINYRTLRKLSRVCHKFTCGGNEEEAVSVKLCVRNVLTIMIIIFVVYIFTMEISRSTVRGGPDVASIR